ncbi:MAG: hypothetical protein JXB50_13400 [Spirochaetes bacterium]|nr:hypothetical protein [Spirochaetota bacterium]
MKNFTYKVAFKPNWNFINKIRKKTFYKLKKHDISFAEEAKLVASELCENAVKYSKSNSNNNIIKFELNKINDKITISVCSNFIINDDINKLKEEIDKINRSEEPEKLYTDRLLYLIENINIGQSQLGLFRIIYETKYKLDYKITGNILDVIAERNLISVEENSYAKL